MSSTLFSTAQNWLNQDPDPQTRTELSQLLNLAQAGDPTATEELTNRFDGRLQFGTAGLRGKQQAGSMGMNRVLVAQTAKGLAQYILQFDANNPSVVIGYDGRKNSDVYAKDTAEIMAGAGIKAWLLPRKLPTPVLAFTLKYLDVSAGVMVTASHNPAEDNGYKVYLGKSNGGGQIVSPADTDIAKLIDEMAKISIQDYPRSQNYQLLDESVINQYIAQTAQLAKEATVPLNYVYTAMHGVGKEVLLKTLTQANLPLPHLVAEQCEPDGNFPTTAFPNPEEKGALDLAIQLAKEVQAEFILANDPDADRLAVAIADEQGNWQALHGNTVGCYLAWYLAKQLQAQGKRGTFACSLVSSPALKMIAQKFGFQHEETLTGFKYIAKVPNLRFGFEEALGYLVDPNKISDKDGISASVVFLDLVRHLKAQGKSLLDHANDFVQEFGAYTSGQISIRLPQLADSEQLMNALRTHPIQTLAGQKVTQHIDYMKNSVPNEILVYHFANGSRLIIRPSGTEPKIKIYLDTTGENATQAKQNLQEMEQNMRALLRQDIYGKQNC